MEAEFVRLCRMPGKIKPPWPLARIPNSVTPPIPGNKIPTWIPNGRYPQFLDQVHDIRTISITISTRMPGFVNSGIDTSAQVLYKRAEQSVVDRTDEITILNNQLGLTVFLTVLCFHSSNRPLLCLDETEYNVVFSVSTYLYK